MKGVVQEEVGNRQKMETEYLIDCFKDLRLHSNHTLEDFYYGSSIYHLKSGHTESHVYCRFKKVKNECDTTHQEDNPVCQPRDGGSWVRVVTMEMEKSKRRLEEFKR